MDILPVKENKEKNKLSIPKPLPNSHFLGIIVGGVKSGKTTLLINLIYRCFKDNFDEIVIFSPNIFNDKIFERNINEDDEITKIPDVNDVDSIVKDIVDAQKKLPKSDRPNILLIFDDVVGYIKRSFLTHFCTRYRQLNISLLFSVQAYRSLPNIIRANASFIIAFRTYNKKELQKLMDEMGHIKGIEDWYEKATSQKYDFMFTDLRNIKVYKCLKELLYDRDRDEFKGGGE